MDEDAYLDDPESFSDGPQAVQLGHVEKDNGAEIPLGLFNNPDMSEVSAVIYSCTATWGKLSAMSENDKTNTTVNSLWATPPNGAPERRRSPVSEHGEEILDDLQIYHNPYADYPLPTDIFHAPRVVQNYVDAGTGDWIYEGRTDSSLHRQVIAIPKVERER